MNNCIDCEHLTDDYIYKYPTDLKKTLAGKCLWWDSITDPHIWTCENFKSKWRDEDE